MQKRKLLVLAVIAAVVAVPSAQAHKGNGWKVVASGLDNPRGIDIAKNGDIWVAEAGKGGAGPCVPSPEGPDAPSVCFGLSGAFTVVHKGWQKRVVSGLPSTATQGTGEGAEGAVDIVVNGKKVTGLIGSGHTPDSRAAFGSGGALFGHVVKVDPWNGAVRPFADISQYEADHNPDGGEIDSNANGITVRHGGYVVADAGGNSVLGVSHKKAITTLGVFADTLADAPPFLGLPAGTQIPLQAVPTTVAVRPKDPNVYVGQLTGFPFPPGAANVWAIAPDGTKSVYASGFTNIIDIAWGPKGSLYVLEIAANGLLSGDPTGALIKVWPNGQKTVVASEGLSEPGGVAIGKDGSVYVTNNATSVGTGTVVNIGKV
jgi:sugar lactone lactonase YvrE